MPDDLSEEEAERIRQTYVRAYQKL
jgi:hypothetical protein